MRDIFLPFALPDVDEAELGQIHEALVSGWVTTGPKTKQFESVFGDCVQAEYSIAVNSCTAAMHLALEAVGLKAGDEVITSPYTFAATAEVIRYFNAKPVFVDIRSSDFNINVDLIESAITSRTRALIPVHIAGLPVDLDAIFGIAEKYNLAVIEDAAHAFPVCYRGRMIGSPPPSSKIMHAVCFSFYATKTITTGEGGMICTNNEEIAERCRIMALHGISKDAWKRYTAEGSWYYEIVAPGYKYNMTDIAAGMGLAQLTKARRMLKRRIEIANKYNEAFQEYKQVLQIPSVHSSDSGHAWHLYMLRFHLDRLGINRNQFIQELKQRNIGTSVHFIPLHLHPYYRDTYGYLPDDFPVAYQEFQREISLPIYSKMSDIDIQDVIEAVIEIVNLHQV
ncbi:MAG: UDP-4-amino-4,6-dideoxy-N-acetyl-beta-L-altrosami ne transaminase [Candidatus Promineifilaceae bacterium]